MTSVVISGLRKTYEGDVTAVDGVDLTVRHGEFLTLLGPSGCGKTTTLRCVAGLEEADAGTIAFDERTVASPAAGVFVPPYRRGIGMVFQSYALWPHMTVFGNVAYPLKLAGMGREPMRQRVAETLAAVGLDGLESRSATRLSGGQQQRVAVARAMANHPGLMLFDEPLSNLDARLRAQMRLELRRLHEAIGTTSIYVTHDQVEAMVLSDRVAVMRSGRIQQLGPPREVYTAPANRFVADFVGFDNFVTGTVTDADGDGPVVRLGQRGPRLRVETDRHLAAGTVDVAIRGSTVVAATVPWDRENAFEAEITGVVFLGEQMQYHVRAGDVGLVVNVPESALHRQDAKWRLEQLDIGDRLHLWVSPRRVVPLPDNLEEDRHAA